MANQRLSALGFFLLFAAYGYLAQEIPLDFWAEEEPFNARSFPQLIAMGGAVLSAILAIAGQAQAHPIDVRAMNWQPCAALLVLMTLYGFALEPIGFIVTTTVFLIGAYVILGERRPVALILASLPVAVGFYFLMDFLGIYLSPGELFLGEGES